MPVQISKKRKFVQDGVFKAELNEFLTRELAEDGYSGVEDIPPRFPSSPRRIPPLDAFLPSPRRVPLLPFLDPPRTNRLAGARDAVSHGNHHSRHAHAERAGQQRPAHP